MFHIPFVTSLPLQYKLHTILERKATPTQSAARDAFASANVVTTIDEVVDNAEIDLVIVSTINDTHYEYTKRALEAGKHVIVEKPVAPTSREAKELAQLAKDKNLVLAVCQWMREEQGLGQNKGDRADDKRDVRSQTRTAGGTLTSSPSRTSSPRESLATSLTSSKLHTHLSTSQRNNSG